MTVPEYMNDLRKQPSQNVIGTVHLYTVLKEIAVVSRECCMTSFHLLSYLI